MVQIKDVEKKYGKFTALYKLSLDIKPGSHLLILGPNGAGKTTLIKSMMGILNFNGTIKIGGIDVNKDPRGAKKMIGYVPQNYAFYEGLTIYDHAVLSTRLKNLGTEQIEEKLKLVNLWEARKRRVRACSDGMKQRLGIALAMIGNPKLLLLDEPTSNVDLRGQLEFQKLLRSLLSQGKTMITTSHLTGLGELATEVMVLDHGKGDHTRAPRGASRAPERQRHDLRPSARSRRARASRSSSESKARSTLSWRESGSGLPSLAPSSSAS